MIAACSSCGAGIKASFDVEMRTVVISKRKFCVYLAAPNLLGSFFPMQGSGLPFC